MYVCMYVCVYLFIYYVCRTKGAQHTTAKKKKQTVGQASTGTTYRPIPSHFQAYFFTPGTIDIYNISANDTCE